MNTLLIVQEYAWIYQCNRVMKFPGQYECSIVVPVTVTNSGSHYRIRQDSKGVVFALCSQYTRISGRALEYLWIARCALCKTSRFANNCIALGPRVMGSKDQSGSCTPIIMNSRFPSPWRLEICPALPVSSLGTSLAHANPAAWSFHSHVQSRTWNSQDLSALL